jgi:L-threonylcarbamoyladenylate synthase
MSETLEPTAAGLDAAADLLRRGELVSVPTETVYGLAANAFDARACRKIFDVKGRPLIDPLIVHLPDLDAVESCAVLNPEARALGARFWPGPLTLVLDKKPRVPDIVTAGLPSVAVRVPAHPVMQALLRRLDFPLAAPSANPFGYLSPTRAAHVLEQLGGRIPAIIDAGPCPFGIESTIADLRHPPEVAILRPGPVGAESIFSVAGLKPAGTSAARPASTGAQTAPGMLSHHYSPRARLVLLGPGQGADPAALSPGPDRPVVLMAKPRTGEGVEGVHWLSESGDATEAAGNLFALLHRLDRPGVREIRVETAGDSGIGRAINDRLRRAAARRD